MRTIPLTSPTVPPEERSNVWLSVNKGKPTVSYSVRTSWDAAINCTAPSCLSSLTPAITASVPFVVPALEPEILKPAFLTVPFICVIDMSPVVVFAPAPSTLT